MSGPEIAHFRSFQASEIMQSLFDSLRPMIQTYFDAFLGMKQSKMLCFISIGRWAKQSCACIDFRKPALMCVRWHELRNSQNSKIILEKIQIFLIQSGAWESNSEAVGITTSDMTGVLIVELVEEDEKYFVERTDISANQLWAELVAALLSA